MNRQKGIDRSEDQYLGKKEEYKSNATERRADNFNEIELEHHYIEPANHSDIQVVALPPSAEKHK